MREKSKHYEMGESASRKYAHAAFVLFVWIDVNKKSNIVTHLKARQLLCSFLEPRILLKLYLDIFAEENC